MVRGSRRDAWTVEQIVLSINRNAVAVTEVPKRRGRLVRFSKSLKRLGRGESQTFVDSVPAAIDRPDGGRCINLVASAYERLEGFGGVNERNTRSCRIAMSIPNSFAVCLQTWGGCVGARI